MSNIVEKMSLKLNVCLCTLMYQRKADLTDSSTVRYCREVFAGSNNSVITAIHVQTFVSSVFIDSDIFKG